MRGNAIALGLVMLLGGGTAVVAQTTASDSTSRQRGEWLIGGSLGVPGYRSEPVLELFTIGVQWTSVGPGRLGADISIGTMPRAFIEGVAVVGLRAGPALPLKLRPGILLIPSAGVSFVGGAGGGGGGGTVGLNGGVAAVFFGPDAPGLRTGITWHRFQDTDAALWLAEVGFVWRRKRTN